MHYLILIIATLEIIFLNLVQYVVLYSAMLKVGFCNRVLVIFYCTANNYEFCFQ
jgi:hypothetical protein